MDLDYETVVGCDCCGYTAEVATSSLSSGIFKGTIKCGRCKNHVSFLMKFVHRFSDWRWVRANLSRD